MLEILATLLLTFFSYYLACLFSINSKPSLIYIILFLVFSSTLRLLVNVNLNNDYFYYYNFDIFHKPSGFLSFLFNEPYLYSVYAFFTLFIDAKKDVFLAMYWFNFFINTLFFIWLLYRKDVEMWKKVLLFVLHYFIFGYIFLRNGPAYILFAMYFYYTFRGVKFRWVVITPFMHISSTLMLVTCFYKKRYYFKMLCIIPVILLLSFLMMKPSLSTIRAFDSILSKIDIYSQGMPFIGVMHIFFFLFVCLLVLTGFILYKSKMLHPIIVTTILFYICTFFINPIVAHRFSPYALFALLLFPFDKFLNERVVILLNRFSIFLFLIYVYTLFNTHEGKLIIDF